MRYLLHVAMQNFAFPGNTVFDLGLCESPIIDSY